MDLFSQELTSPINILPQDGIVYYYGEVMEQLDAQKSFEQLFTQLPWQCDQAVVMGKLISTKRKVAWFGDDPFQYTYSQVTKQALPWAEDLLLLKVLVEEKTGEHYNSCLVNLYHSGEEGMAWHSDGEKDLKKEGAIASLSLGAERKFSFKHKENKQVVSLTLKQGSLLVMKGVTQQCWLHRLPPSKKVTEPRINLTFRTIVR
ncbi:alpha-ketoglutarate-dependent dioxygenase AlkB family protein [Litorilituus lipolyticus]|uniref:Alpha-ketoglutarate-dependent dioxygenase AlkB n=1 Tax=Litorilituus lipolyticus TaxID=2491017 RepID=A0A502L919_9GAMM|nr:alpha-ketoglutarate-dependent dioxygenase AlkB [Litorilituus lipolyticus]TPH18593.1 alpha-ketoglutarate-dependent dioxygenase AlkB [Litorilituus lipolyticus]